MRRFLPIALAIAAIALFLIANRGAYEGYFSDDDLDNIAWTRVTEPSSFLIALATPRYYPQHFRPVGHATFHVMSGMAGLNFKPWIGLVHALHFATTVLVFLLLLRFGVSRGYAAAGALFFLFNMAVFDAIWKPMYLFDVWCGLFSLGCLLAWTHRRYVLAFACFWFAFKSKEHAIMLPFVLMAYEWWLGEKKWKPLLPFFGLAGALAAQAFYLNHTQGDEYRIHLSPWTFVKTGSFYLSRIMIYPWLGVALLFVPVFVRERRVWFTMLAAGLFMLPLLILPGRLFAAYLYLSLAVLAVGFGVAFSRFAWPVTAVFFALWLPYNYVQLKAQRKAALTTAQENQAYVAQVLPLAKEYPDVRRFIYDGTPEGLRWWGIQGALRWTYRTLDLEVTPVDAKDLSQVFAAGPVAMLSWDAPVRKLVVTARKPNQPDEPYVKMSRYMPVWQLENGWYQNENKYRWTAPEASARLYRPADAKAFGLEVNVGPKYIEIIKRSTVFVFLNGKPAGQASFDHSGWQTVRLPIEPGPAGTVEFSMKVDPAFQPSPDEPRKLGIAVGGFGFVP